MSVEKLDTVQQGLDELEQQLTAVLTAQEQQALELTLERVKKAYKVKKEIIRLARVYFLYNLEGDNLKKYGNLCKLALVRDKPT